MTLRGREMNDVGWMILYILFEMLVMCCDL
jgi:hypothetical protein